MVPSPQALLAKTLQQSQLDPQQALKSIELASSTISHLTDPYKDAMGRVLSLWKISPGIFFGTVTHIDGQVTFISSDKILNPLVQAPSLQALRKIELLGQRKWNLVYLEPKGTITIWPQMIAAAQDDPIPAEIRFPPPGGKLEHIFNPEKPWGHFPYPTEEAKKLLIEMFSDPANRVATDNYGNGIYLKMLPNGMQLWGELRPSGLINNAGRGFTPREWVPDSDNPGGGSTKPIPQPTAAIKESDFKDRLQTNNLVDSYNACHPNHPMARGKATSGQIGGVGNEVGIILGLFDGIQVQFETEHAFFFPTPDGFSLSTEEIQRILHELAVGIFVHDTIPFY